MLKRLSLQWLAISLISVITTACGGGGGGSGGSNPNSAAQTPSSSPTPTTTPTTTPSASGNHSVHITWTAPTTRADGSALVASALAGYRLFYILDGTNPSQDNVIAINGGMTTSTDLSLSTGSYTFAITALDSSGTESALSTPVSITIN